MAALSSYTGLPFIGLLSSATAAQAPDIVPLPRPDPRKGTGGTEYHIPRCPTGYHRQGGVCRIILPRRHRYG
jgi:hypothetical protein